MCKLKRAVFLLVFAWFLQGGLFLEPCSEIFKFQSSKSNNILAQLIFENDLSGIFNLKLKVASNFNCSIQVVRSTSNEDVQNGKNVVYNVTFSKKCGTTPFNVIFNEKLYCNDFVPNGTIIVQNIFHRSSSFNSNYLTSRSESKESWQPQISQNQPETVSQQFSRLQRMRRESPGRPTSMENGNTPEHSPLILEGNLTKEEEFPWLVAFFHSDGANYKYKCAGTLISNKHVITAAHCVKVEKKRLYAVLGNRNIENWLADSILRRADKIIVHPDYVNVSHADLAVVIMEAPVSFSKLITSVSLWDEPVHIDNVIGQKGAIAGWGGDESGNLYVTKARQITLPIVGEATCLRSNFNFVSITSRKTFCAGARDGKIPCRGDSGSGFVMKRKGKWKLRGIVSSALSDPRHVSCDGSHYAVFTDVAKYTTWLTSTLKEETTNIRSQSQTTDGTKVICLFDNIAGERPGAGKFLPEDIDEDLCTHIIYGFAVLDENSLILKPGDTSLDIDKKMYNKIISFRSKGVKVLISLGSFTDSQKGDKYSRLAKDAVARARFIIHATQFIEAWGFDGLEFDWQYPSNWHGKLDNETDIIEFAQFVKELHEAFAPRGWLLSGVVSAFKNVIDKAYDIPTLNKYLDWFSVICYDYHGAWYEQTGHIAPLYNYPGYHSIYNANYTLNYLIHLGADPKKLVMRLASYGQSFTLADPNEHGLKSKSIGFGLPSNFTNNRSKHSFYEICTKIRYEKWKVVRDPNGRIGPYTYRGNQWISYDDIAEFKRKAQYVKANGLGGAMIWSVDLDDFSNMCGCGRYPLLRMLNHELRGVPLQSNLENCT